MQAGPPCETFCIARWNSLGPPPLRSCDWPYGLPGLTVRQQLQTSISTELLCTTVIFTHTLMVAGGFALIEHPAPLQWHVDFGAASIWSLHAIQVIADHPDVAFHVVEQGRFGAKSCKPTGLLALRLPTLHDRLQQLGTYPVPKSVSVGKDSDGTYKTASLKEYPSRLCKSFALSMVDSLDGVDWNGAWSAQDAHYADQVMPHDVYWDMGADFWQ